MKIKIGITGTRSGSTDKQLTELAEFFTKLQEENPNAEFELHHGDCVGADVETAIVATMHGFKTISHPPIKEDLRAFHSSTETRKPFSYFARNRNIVEETDMLLVIPYQNTHQSSGGTWYTHDYAVKTKKPIILLWPSEESPAESTT